MLSRRDLLRLGALIVPVGAGAAVATRKPPPEPDTWTVDIRFAPQPWRYLVLLDGLAVDGAVAALTGGAKKTVLVMSFDEDGGVLIHRRQAGGPRCSCPANRNLLAWRRTSVSPEAACIPLTALVGDVEVLFDQKAVDYRGAWVRRMADGRLKLEPPRFRPAERTSQEEADLAVLRVEKGR